MSRRGARRPPSQVDRVRLAAVDVFRRWVAGARPVSALVEDLEGRLESGASPWSYDERRRLRELVFGSVRLKQRYATMVEHHATRPGRIRSGVAAALTVALHEICEMRTPAFAAVDQAVRIVRHQESEASARFVNAVLRGVLRQGVEAGFPSADEEPVAHATTWLSHPRWMVERWAQQMGTEDMLALCRANNERPHLTVRTPWGRRDEVRDAFEGFGWESRLSLHAPQAIQLLTRVPAPLVLDQVPVPLVIQDEAAQLIAPLCLGDMAPPRGERTAPGPQTLRILDLCAAPGGKASHLAELAGDRAQVVASDISPRRARRLRETLSRVEPIRSEVVIADGRWLPFARDVFDIVLVDAPCTGTGVLARRHDARWRRTLEDLHALAKLQDQLLNFAVDVARPGGIIVYATCSLEPEENDAVVDALLVRRDDVIELGAGGTVFEDLCPQGRLRTWPHRHGMDGAFAARLRKEA